MVVTPYLLNSMKFHLLVPNAMVRDVSGVIRNEYKH